MSWFKRENGEYESGPGPENGGADTSEKSVRTEGLWIKCPGCRQPIFRPDLGANLNVCPKCQYHFKLGARERIELLLEPGYELVDMGLRSTDPLNFSDVKPYKQRLRAAQESTGLNDAIVNAVGQLGPHAVVISAMEYGFIGGSMGAVVGETIARAVDRARLGRKPLIVVATSGGARMMEGVVSLMQMAKISTALAQLDNGQLCDAWRLEHCRTGCADWFCGSAGHRTDDSAEIAGGLSAFGVSVGEGISGCGGAKERAEGLSDSGSGVLEGLTLAAAKSVQSKQQKPRRKSGAFAWVWRHQHAWRRRQDPRK